MSRTSNTLINRAIRRFIILPLILIFGIYIVGTLVEAFFGIPAAATSIFLGVGGVAFLIYYYRDWIKRIMMR